MVVAFLNLNTVLNNHLIQYDHIYKHLKAGGQDGENRGRQGGGGEGAGGCER